MDYPDKFTVLLELLVKKELLTEGEYNEYYKERTKELNQQIKQQYKNFYKEV